MIWNLRTSPHGQILRNMIFRRFVHCDVQSYRVCWEDCSSLHWVLRGWRRVLHYAASLLSSRRSGGPLSPPVSPSLHSSLGHKNMYHTELKFHFLGLFFLCIGSFWGFTETSYTGKDFSYPDLSIIMDEKPQKKMCLEIYLHPWRYLRYSHLLQSLSLPPHEPPPVQIIIYTLKWESFLSFSLLQQKSGDFEIWNLAVISIRLLCKTAKTAIGRCQTARYVVATAQTFLSCWVHLE